jgi:hypothetical protein
VTYSKKPVNWDKMPKHPKKLEVKDGPRHILSFQPSGAVVLHFEHPDLNDQHDAYVKAGCSHDFPDFKSHVTLSYKGAPTDVSKINPYLGPLHFGEEVRDEIKESFTPGAEVTESVC